jgi:hypothetical protein
MTEPSSLPLKGNVEPKNRTIFGPQQCEKQAARIRNSTAEAVNAEDKNYSRIAYKYIQNKTGERNSKIYTALYGLFAAAPAGILMGLVQTGAVEPVLGYVPGVLLGVAGIGGMLANTGHINRYKKSKEACEELLTGNFGEDGLGAIKKMTYDHSGILALNDFLGEKGLESVENKFPELSVLGQCGGFIARIVGGRAQNAERNGISMA